MRRGSGGIAGHTEVGALCGPNGMAGRRLVSGDRDKIGIHVSLIFAANKRSAVAIRASSPSAGSIQL